VKLYPLRLVFVNSVHSARIYGHALGLGNGVSKPVRISRCHSQLISRRSIIGPMVGGALARPCISYPKLFPQGSIWDRWPYLLPNLCCAILLVVGASIGALFMEETNPQISRRDPALEFGDWITSLWSRPNNQKTPTTEPGSARAPRMAQRIASSQRLSRSSTDSSVFNRQVLLNIASYGILAL
jgi:hypothetical protein